MASEKLLGLARTARNYLKTEPFIPVNPPLTLEEMQARERNMLLGTNLRDRVIDGVRVVITVPSAGDHYGWDSFKWDGVSAAAETAMIGEPQLAALEMRTIDRYRDTRTGFMPNKVRLEGVSDKEYKRGRPECYTQMREGRSSYSQPSLEGWAVLKIYEGYEQKIKSAENNGNLTEKQSLEDEARSFLHDIYGTVEQLSPTGETTPYFTGLRGECEYFIRTRQASENNPLIFNIHPNETGRDYAHELDGPDVHDVPGKGKVIVLFNTGRRWLKTQIFNSSMARRGREEGSELLPEEQRRSDWIPEKVREKHANYDVMFNAMHTWNLRNTAQVARKLAELSPEDAKIYLEDAARYEAIAHTVEEEILTRMWHEKQDENDTQEDFFYNLNKNYKQINVRSISGLFPLMLSNLPVKKLDTLLSRIEDPAWFATPYPIPSHPRSSNYYDPHYTRREGPDWQGPVWGITNYFLVEEGLVSQAERFLDPESKDYNPDQGRRCMNLAGHIVQQGRNILSINAKTREQANPETGQGQRVEDFLWSNLMLHSEKYNAVKEKYGL